MKRGMNVWKRNLVLIGGFVLSIVLFTACNKDNNPAPATPAAGFMAFNLSIDKPTVGFALSGNPVTNTGLTYPAYTGNYLPVFIGNREVRSYDFITNETLATTNVTFADSMYYSAFLVGNNGTYENIVVEDDYENVVPMAGKAWVRYINAIPDSSITPNISVGDMSNNVSYKTVSNFETVDAGSLNLAISDGSSVNASRTITVDENKIYTVLFVGLPNQTDTSRNVMVRYVLNGTATN